MFFEQLPQRKRCPAWVVAMGFEPENYRQQGSSTPSLSAIFLNKINSWNKVMGIAANRFSPRGVWDS
jgi:hypothetical protein